MLQITDDLLLTPTLSIRGSLGSSTDPSTIKALTYLFEAPVPQIRCKDLPRYFGCDNYSDLTGYIGINMIARVQRFITLENALSFISASNPPIN